MIFKKEELYNFTKEELIKHINDLYIELEQYDKPKKRIILTNAPDIVKNYVKEMEVNKVE